MAAAAAAAEPSWKSLGAVPVRAAISRLVISAAVVGRDVVEWMAARAVVNVEGRGTAAVVVVVVACVCAAVVAVAGLGSVVVPVDVERCAAATAAVPTTVEAARSAATMSSVEMSTPEEFREGARTVARTAVPLAEWMVMVAVGGLRGSGRTDASGAVEGGGGSNVDCRGVARH